MSHIQHNLSSHQNANHNIRPIAELMNDLKTKMELVFHDRASIDQMETVRGLPPFVLQEIMSINPLSVCIKKEYGGRGAFTHEILQLLSTASYESLALCLTFGINAALFLQPFAKYGQEEVKAPVFKRFLEEKAMGGLMITEPNFGSDALNMQTSYHEKEGRYHLKGMKHWAGLTGWADYWLMTARRESARGDLERDIDFSWLTSTHRDRELSLRRFLRTWDYIPYLTVKTESICQCLLLINCNLIPPASR